MNNICKFQYSFFLAGRDSPQIVVRGDNFEEFILDVDKAKTEFDKTSRQKNEPFPQEKPLLASPSESSDMSSYCSIHKLEMKERINKKNNAKFYSHYIGTYPNGTYCSGK